MKEKKKTKKKKKKKTEKKAWVRVGETVLYNDLPLLMLSAV